MFPPLHYKQPIYTICIMYMSGYIIITDIFRIITIQTYFFFNLFERIYMTTAPIYLASTLSIILKLPTLEM